MESNKALTSDQLNKLKESIRQRFDELYQRIGTNRQTLSTKVLQVDQAINKELTKEKIGTDYEKEILRRVREIERTANNQLPHVHKVAVPSSTPAAKPSKPAKDEKPAKAAKPAKPAKAKKK